MVCSIIVHALKEVLPQVNVLFYADNLLLSHCPHAPHARCSPTSSNNFDYLAFLWDSKSPCLSQPSLPRGCGLTSVYISCGHSGWK